MSEEHIKPLRLFDAARDKVCRGIASIKEKETTMVKAKELTGEQKKHFLQCDECQYVFAAFTRQFNRQRQLYEKGTAA